MSQSTPVDVDRFTLSLTRTERYVLTLFYAEELCVSEIGLVLDLPAHRVGEILSDLRSRARRLMGQIAGR